MSETTGLVTVVDNTKRADGRGPTADDLGRREATPARLHTLLHECDEPNPPMVCTAWQITA